MTPSCCILPATSVTEVRPHAEHFGEQFLRQGDGVSLAARSADCKSQRPEIALRPDAARLQAAVMRAWVSSTSLK